LRRCLRNAQNFATTFGHEQSGFSELDPPRAEPAPIFSFYMGKSTPERKDYIMDSLVVPVEE
jgi:hypothetical protein